MKLSECDDITDDGISLVITHCNQLRELNLMSLEYIRGMCALVKTLNVYFIL